MQLVFSNNTTKNASCKVLPKEPPGGERVVGGGGDGEGQKSYFPFQLFMKLGNEKNAVDASLLMKFYLNPWFVVNFVGLQTAQAPNHFSKLY